MGFVMNAATCPATGLEVGYCGCSVHRTAQTRNAADLSGCLDLLGEMTDEELVGLSRVIQEERASRKDASSGAPPAANRRDDYRPKPMSMPTINWAEAKRELDGQQKAPTANKCSCGSSTREENGEELQKWLGAGGYPTLNDDDGDDYEDDTGGDDFTPKPLKLPTINWAEEKRLLDRGSR